MRPTDALVFQDEQIRFAQSAPGAAYLSTWEQMRTADGVPVIESVNGNHLKMHVHRLVSANAFWVSEEMMEVAVHAAQSMPDQPMLETDPPCPAGWVVLEKAMIMQDARGIDCAVGAMLWGIHKLGEREDREFHGRRGIAWSFFADTLDPRDKYNGIEVRKRIQQPRYVLLHEDVEVFGEAPSTPADIIETLQEKYKGTALPTPEIIQQMLFRTRAVPLALWALMQQRIAVTTEHRVERVVRRRMQKEGSRITSDTVRVVTLRRAREDEPDHESKPGNWSQRWMVGGHWRNQYLPSVKAHRLTWIAPYIKGPVDMPLRLKRKVHQLVR